MGREPTAAVSARGCARRRPRWLARHRGARTILSSRITSSCASSSSLSSSLSERLSERRAASRADAASCCWRKETSPSDLSAETAREGRGRAGGGGVRAWGRTERRRGGPRRAGARGGEPAGLCGRRLAWPRTARRGVARAARARTVVLVLVEQVLHLLLVDLHLDRVPLLELLGRAVLVAQLGPRLGELLLGDLPKGVDLVLRRREQARGGGAEVGGGGHAARRRGPGAARQRGPVRAGRPRRRLGSAARQRQGHGHGLAEEPTRAA